METKRRRLVADTADDLQHILFGDMDAEDAAPGGAETAVLPVENAEVDVVESYSDSDKDSMDEFIVRDTHEDKEHRLMQSYTDRYGEDVGETLNDVIAVFGDLRILDMYSRDASRISTISPVEDQFSAEELRTEYATDIDTLIAETDCCERVQERFGTSKALEPLLAFEQNDPDAISRFEKEWAIESRWLYVVLRERAARLEKGAQDWTLWTPAQLVDPEAIPDFPPNPDHSALTNLACVDQESAVIARIHVFLRDLKGRGFDPHYIWSSMGRSKYVWFLNLDDLIAIQLLDNEWSNSVGPKYLRLMDRITAIYAEVDSVLSTDESFVLADSVRIELANLKSDLAFQASEGMTPEFAVALDDFALCLSVEIEPILAFIKVGTALAVASTTRKVRRPAGTSASLVSQIIGKKYNETMLPLLSLSPREIGENLHLGARLHKGPDMGSAGGAPPADRQLLIEYLSTSVAANVKVRSWYRAQVRRRAVISTHPVGAPITCTSFMYTLRRTCMRPIADFFGTEMYLGMHSLAVRGEILIDLLVLDDQGRIVCDPKTDDDLFADASDEVVERNLALKREESGSSHVADQDPLLSDLLYYMKPEVFDSEWLAALRVSVGQAIIAKLSKSIKAELLRDLLVDNVCVAGLKIGREFEKLACVDAVRGKLTSQGKSLVGKDFGSLDRRLVWELVGRQLKTAHCTVMTAVIEKLANGARTHLAIVNPKGDLVEHVHLDHLLSKWAPKYSSDFERAQKMIKEHYPSVVIVGADDWKSRSLVAELTKATSWVYQDTEANGYLECPEVFLSVLKGGNDPISKCVSLARSQQCPLAELVASDCPSLHPLQAYIGPSIVEQYVHAAAAKVVALLGVDLNDAITSEARSVLLEFVPGMGPRKARLLREKADATLRGIDDKAGERINRLEEILGKRVALCAQPFLKLQPQLDQVVQLLMEYDVEGIDDGDDESDDSSDSSSSSSSDSSSDSSEDQSEWTKDADKGAESQSEWTKDAEGNWIKSGEATKGAESQSEWTKDAEGNWTKSGQSEWTKDAEGNWTKSGQSEWTKDAEGNWIKPGAKTYKSNGWELFHFGVPNKLYQGIPFLEMCRFAKECWPVVRAIFATDKIMFEKMGSTEDTTNVSDLVDMIFSADERPAHLCDPEVDLNSLKLGAQSVVSTLLIPQVLGPFKTNFRTWRPSSAMAVFYACVHENPSDFNSWTAVTAVVKDASKDTVKVTEVGTGIDGTLTKGYNDYRTKYYAGDSVRCRIAGIDFPKFAVSFTTEPVADTFRKPYFVCRSSDFDHLRVGLGKVEPLAVTDESRTVLKTRRIIKHDSYHEISHANAVRKLAENPVGDVIFRPSSSQPGQYFGLIKIKPLTESVDPTREDWIKTFRFVESVSSRFQIVETGEEFEEFDQMKVLYVEKYLAKLQELLAHPKFRPESIDRVANLVKAKSMANKGSVAYSFVMDPSRESAGNAILLWTDGERTFQDPIEVTNRGFKWWTKGPYASLTALVNWWKMGGYRERQTLIAEYQQARAECSKKDDKDDNSWNKKDDQTWPKKDDQTWPKKDDNSSWNKQDDHNSWTNRDDKSWPNKDDKSWPSKDDKSWPNKDDKSWPNRDDKSWPNRDDSSWTKKGDSSWDNRQGSNRDSYGGQKW